MSGAASPSREAILRRIRMALGDVASDGSAAEARRPAYRQRLDAPAGELVARFAKRVAEYRATVRCIAAGETATATGKLLAAAGARRVGVPVDLPAAWHPAGVELVPDVGLSHHALERLEAVLTGCAVAIAETGTLVLDGGAAQGRRALTLLPDHHVCVVSVEQVVGLVPEAISALADAAARGQPITFISGPSATSDIELSRVEGVHGPRRLDVIIVG